MLVAAMSHKCRTADRLLGLETILALGFRRARAPRRRGLVDITAHNDLVTELTVTKLKPDRPLTVQTADNVYNT